MTKAIEARRELLATATTLSDRYENECGPETDVDLAGAALEHAVATKEYLEAEEAAPLLPIVQLSPDHPIAHAKVGDYDHWIGFVCQKIDRAAGFEVDVKARPWGDGGPTKVLADDARGDRIYEAILTLRDEFLAVEAMLSVKVAGPTSEAEVHVSEDGDAIQINVTEPYTGPATIVVGRQTDEDDHGSR